MRLITYNHKSFRNSEYFQRLPGKEQQKFDLLTRVFHFKANNYVLDELIDWDHIPDDPMYKLLFSRSSMLSPEDLNLLSTLTEQRDAEVLVSSFVQGLKEKMFPDIKFHQACLPVLNGTPVTGAYRSFKNQLSLFPAPMVRTCHSYCSYCFRWISFDDTEMQNNSAYHDPETPVPYLKAHPEISDVVFTGADPMIINAKILRKYIEPLLEVESVKCISITTKSLAWWPYRYLTDKDAKEILDLFEEINRHGKHLNLLAHFSHPRELGSAAVREAVTKIRQTGTTIRSQAPLVEGINDSPEDWSTLWNQQVNQGIVPFMMFMELDHNKEGCFRVPLARALNVFNEAKTKITGLSVSVLGPVFTNDVIRVVLDGIVEIEGSEYFALKCLQSPFPEMEGQIRLLPYDEHTSKAGDLLALFNDNTELTVAN